MRALFRKILMSVTFFARNSGAGMRQLYGPLEKFRSFCRETLHAHKIFRFFGGGGVFGVLAGGSADLIFMGAGFFLKRTTRRVQESGRYLS